MRLAEEYDAAQERGEVAGHGRSKVEADNVTTTAELGLRRDEIHAARRLHDAEAADPGVIQRTFNCCGVCRRPGSLECSQGFRPNS
jgi:hypothetical protein